MPGNAYDLQKDYINKAIEHLNRSNNYCELAWSEDPEGTVLTELELTHLQRLIQDALLQLSYIRSKWHSTERIGYG